MVDLSRFKANLRARLGAVKYDAWFEAPICLVIFETRGINDQTLVVRVQKPFFRDWIITRFGTTIHDVAQDTGFKRACILHENEDFPPVPPPRDRTQLEQSIAAFKDEMREREEKRARDAVKRLSQKDADPLLPVYAS